MLNVYTYVIIYKYQSDLNFIYKRKVKKIIKGFDTFYSQKK